MKNNPQFSCYFNTTLIFFLPLNTFTHACTFVIEKFNTSLTLCRFYHVIMAACVVSIGQRFVLHNCGKRFIHRLKSKYYMSLYSPFVCLERKKAFFPLPKIFMPYFYRLFGWRGSRVELAKNKLILC